MNNIEVFPLSLEDIDAVTAINLLSFSTPWSRESIARELEENKFAKYIVAKKNNIVVGYAGIWIILDEAHITNIAVHPEYRGIGIGNMLMDALISVCKLEMIPSLTLEVRKSNAVAQSLYKKYGFEEEGVRKQYYGDNKEDAIIMWKHNI